MKYVTLSKKKQKTNAILSQILCNITIYSICLKTETNMFFLTKISLSETEIFQNFPFKHNVFILFTFDVTASVTVRVIIPTALSQYKHTVWMNAVILV